MQHKCSHQPTEILMDKQANELISASELAAIAGRSASLIARLCREGRIQAVRRGRVWMVDPMTVLPPDGRVARREARLARKARWKALRDAGFPADLMDAGEEARLQRELDRREWKVL